MPANTDAADRLMVRYAAHRLSPAEADDLFAVLDAARDRCKTMAPGEDPKATQLAALLVGWELHDFAVGRVAAGRRGRVLAAAREWLEDVVQVTDEQYRMTVGGWAQRAKAARADSAKAFAPRVGGRA